MSAPDPPVERVVLLDEQGRATGTMPKAEVHHRDTPLHLAFSCYVTDGAGRVLLTQRSLTKPTWPGAWTNTCCGHPGPGEPLLHAVRRRLADELGLIVRDVRVVLPGFRYRATMPDGTVENEMCPVLVARADATAALDPDPAEVASTEWVPWHDFRAAVLTGRRAVSPWCAQQVAALTPDPWSGAVVPGRLPPAAVAES
jgi:isopentenyl-diphosphate Delta-isomerase